MAFPNISDIVASTMEKRSKKVADNVTQNNALLARLREKKNLKPFSGGRIIYEELSFAANANASSYSGYDVLPMAAQDVISAAEFNLKQYAAPVVISGLEELQNSGEEQLFDLLEGRLKVAEASLVNKIADGVYSDGTGNNSKDITGLALAVPQDPTSGTYGGIDRATWTFWQSKLYDPGSTPTATTIQQYMNTLWSYCVRGSDRPDLIIAGSTIWGTFMASLQAMQQFVSADTAKLGFPSTKYMTADVVLDGTDSDLTATDMLFLNTNYLALRTHTKRNFVPIGPEKRYAYNQDASAVVLGWAGNLTCAASKLQGRLKGD